MVDWLVHHYRISVFTVSPLAVKAESQGSLFSDIIGANHDEYNEQLSGVVKRHTGTSPEGFRAEVLQQPKRLDVTWLGRTDLAVAPLQSSLRDSGLGSIDIIDTLRPAERSILDRVTDPVRIAKFAYLYLPQSDVEGCYRTLAAMLPHLNLDVQNTSDFLMQINRFTLSEIVPDVQLNRISVYGAQASPLVMGQSGSIPLATDAFWVQLALDINTDARRSVPIPMEHLAPLFDELHGSLLKSSQSFQ